MTDVTKKLSFCVFENGELLELSEEPTLENPAASYGVLDLNTQGIIVDAGLLFELGGPQWLFEFEIADTDADHIFRYYIRAVSNGRVWYLPRTTAFVTSAMLAIGRYTDSDKIEKAFGVDNVHKWLGIDDNEDATDYALRAYGFIAAAEAEIDDLLRGGPCDVPFADPVPALITTIATNLAGVRFYEARGVVDTNPETGQVQHRLQFQAKWVDRQIGRIKAGQIQLAVNKVTRHPRIVS